jgi:hypothetical protein
MIAVLHITCPHCGTGGQVVLPGPGAIVVGPCPQCGEIMAIFCGTALPLDKEVVMNGSREDRQEHVREVLTAHLDLQIDQLVEQMLTEGSAISGEEAMRPEAPEPEETAAPDIGAFPADQPMHPMVRRPITDPEVSRFVHHDLRMLDNRDYFRAIFD